MSTFQDKTFSDSCAATFRISADKAGEPFPLLGAQNAIFTQWRLFPESTQYNIPIYISFSSQYSVADICAALSAVVQNHPQLHSAFGINDDGLPFQTVSDEPIDVAILETTEKELADKLRSLVVPFDLLNKIPIRFAILKTELNRYLFFDFHHVVIDGFSCNFFVRQLERALRGEPLESEIVSVADCVAAEEQRRQLSLTDDLAFFEKILSNGGNVELPMKTNRDASTFDQIIRRWKNDAPLEFIREHSFTPAHLLSSSLTLTLCRLSRKNKTILAQINHGRAERDWGRTIGEFSRNVPIAMGNEPSETVVDYLIRNQKLLRECWKRLTPTSEELTRQCETPPSVFFSFQKNASDTYSSETMTIYRLPVDDPIMPLCFEIFECGEEWEVRLDYDAGIYERKTVEILFDAWKRILDAMIASPDSLCDSLEVVSPEEKETLLTLGTGECLDFDRSETFIRLFQKQTLRHPEKTAVVAQDKTLTFRQLDEKSNALARRLNELGAASGKFVCVMLPRTSDFPVAVLAIFKSGAAYVPLDAEYPTERLAYMLEDSQSEILVTISTFYEEKNADDRFPAKNLLFLDLEDLDGKSNPSAAKPIAKPIAEPIAEPIDESRPEAAAYMIYTSGSTGKPKGVVVPHRALTALIHNANQYNQETDRLLCFCSFSFDASVNDLFPTLALGAELYIVPENLRQDMEGLNAWIKEHKITGGTFPTRFGIDFLSLFDPGFEHVIMGGETMTPFPAPKRTMVFNIYGPTEFTVSSDVYLMNPAQKGNVPIGRPYPNTANYIIDQTGHLLPIGYPGELCLAGEQIALGYWNRPDITAERFVTNPWSTGENDRLMYRTGDLVRWNADGNLEYIGRIDTQVKLRGFRIELGEIEQAIRNYEGVTEAVATVSNNNGPAQLCAWFIATAPVETEKLRDFLAQSLADYMVPTSLRQLTEFPVTPNGKIDRRKLSNEPLQSETTAPGPQTLNRLEKELTQIIAELLGSSHFRTDENLIRYGLTSLTAIRLTVILNKRYGVVLPAPSLMRHCSILDLEDKILETILQPPVSSDESVKTSQKTPALSLSSSSAPSSSLPSSSLSSSSLSSNEPKVSPLTAPQTGIYYEVMKNPEKTLYNIPIRYTFPATFDANRLAKTLAEALALHPTIFSHFEEREGEIVQVGATSIVPEIQRLTLDDKSFEKFLCDFPQPFQPTQEPLYRAAIVQTPNSVELLLDIHHLVCDGVSISILLQDLAAIWKGEQPNPEERGYAEFAFEDSEKRRGENRRKGEEYVARLLENFESATEIPPDFEGNAVSGTLQEAALKADAAVLDQFCTEFGVTPAQLFLAGTTLAIARFTGHDEIFLSMIESGRDDIRDQNTVGMFVRTLPFAGRLSRGISALDFVHSVGETLYATMKKRTQPFAEIAAHYDFHTKIMFTCELGVLPDIMIGDIAPQTTLFGLNAPKYPVSIHIEQRNGDPTLAVQYDSGLFRPFKMQMLAESILQAVRALTTDPTRDVSSLSIVSQEQNRLLEKFRITAKEPLSQGTVPRIFEAHAAQNPERTALIACDRTFSFSELDAAANRLAAALIRRGVSKEDRIVSLTPRSSRAILALLGIMKSGGVYVPCDPEYPQDRIQTIADDCSASFILTTADRASKFGERGLDIETLLAEETDALSLPDIAPDQLAYIIYTSGSTGKPKGVMIEHQGIANYVAPHSATPHVLAIRNETRALLSVTTVSFDMSFKEILVALCNGIALVFADEEQRRNPVALAKLFAVSKADAFNATPSQMRTFLEYAPLCDALAQCRVLMAGAEPFPEALRNDLLQISPARLFNTYGPTEITVSSNVRELVLDDEPINVGRPVLNVVEYIVDSDGNELPPEAIGELLIGGLGVARGYVEAPEKTARSFVTRFGTRIYRSGDRAAWNEKGNVVVWGRMDSQVKLRGLRIELGEVEHAADFVPGVKQAVAGIVSLDSTEHLALWYAADESISAESFRNVLRKTLPNYMIPTAFQKMDHLPVTANGKIDRTKLPTPILTDATDFVPPANDREAAFCDIFAKTLHKSRIGTLDNFFDAGGTSLLATGVIIEAQKRGLKIAYRDLFAHPTPRALAALNSDNSDSSNATDSPQSQRNDAVVSSFDYTEIDRLLQTNNVESFLSEPSQSLGTVLLTGATGFLGIHLLASYLERETGTIYCLVRSHGGRSAQERLKAMLAYYFSDRYIDEVGRRIQVLQGDVTDVDSLSAIDAKIDVVFNCAANVKHFSQHGDVDLVNRIGAENIVAFCCERKCRLVQISTTSVAGTVSKDANLLESTLTEQKLYFGQNVDNQYVQSKFLAERAVLAAATNGLSAKIIRVGNLSARFSDGEFQANFVTNSFVGRLNALAMIGKIPYSFAASPMEFSPIDLVAEAILTLATTPESCRVFHAFNPYPVYYSDIALAFESCGYRFDYVDDAEFQKICDEIGSDPEKAKVFVGFVAYHYSNDSSIASCPKNCQYTVQILLRLGWKWPIIHTEYIQEFIEKLVGLGYFQQETTDVNRNR